MLLLYSGYERQLVRTTGQCCWWCWWFFASKSAIFCVPVGFKLHRLRLIAAEADYAISRHVPSFPFRQQQGWVCRETVEGLSGISAAGGGLRHVVSLSARDGAVSRDGNCHIKREWAKTWSKRRKKPRQTTELQARIWDGLFLSSNQSERFSAQRFCSSISVEVSSDKHWCQ